MPEEINLPLLNSVVDMKSLPVAFTFAAHVTMIAWHVPAATILQMTDTCYSLAVAIHFTEIAL